MKGPRRLTERQGQVLSFMAGAGRPLVRFDQIGGREQFYCGEAAGNHVHTWVALGLIVKGFVTLDTEHTDPRHYWINDDGRRALATWVAGRSDAIG